MNNSKVIIWGLLLIILSMMYQGHRVNTTYDKLSNDNTYQVRIKSDLKVTDEYVSFIGRVNNQRVICYYYIDDSFDIDKINFNYVYNIDVSSIDKIENKYHNPSSFNYEQYMLSRKIKTKVTISSVSGVQEKYGLIGFFQNLRMKLIASNLKRYPDIASYINALVFGYKDIDDDVYQAYIDLSLVHIFAISGSHVIIIVAILRYIFSLFKLRSDQIDKLLIITLLIYVIFTQATPSVMRAVLMIIIKLLFSNRVTRFQSILYVMIINLILNPFSLLNVGFQLSYLIVYVLIIFSDLFNKINHNISRLIVIQLVINLFTFPIVNHMNYSVNIFSYLLNIIIVPVVMFILFPLSLILTLIDIGILADAYGLIINIIESVIAIFDNFTYYIGNINMLLTDIYYGLLIGIVIYYIKDKVINKQLLSACLTIIVIVMINFHVFGSVNIVDVNQGDGILIRLPLNKGNIVIDIGNENSTSEMISYLKYCGINQVDALIITHMHNDHYGDFQSFINNVDVEKTYISEYNEAIVGEDVVTLKHGDTLNYKGYNFEILAPFATDSNLNNQSLVIKCRLGNDKWLFMGDAEQDVEEQMLNTYSEDYLDVDRLKIGHHGSKTSSTEVFLLATSPDDAYISAGKDNMYGHPSQEVVDRLNKWQIKIHLTMTDGLIKVYFI